MNNRIVLEFPDGTKREYEKNITGLEVAKTISHSLAREVLAISVDEEIWDATRPINKDSKIKLLKWEDEGGKYAFWHSSAHLLAEAIQSYFPDVKLGIGPPIQNGFYYDIDFGNYTFSSEELPRIEKKMLELAQKKSLYTRHLMKKAAAIKFFTEKNDPYKLELIKNLEDGNITFYEHGNFTDLCRGGHLPDTSYIKAVKLLNVAAAYWRGDEKNKQLTRIYGITFPKQKLLDEYLTLLEEAKKRDHRKIGKELKLFTYSSKVGLGLPLWLPKGTIIREELEKFLRNAQKKAGYEAVVTPHIGHKNLYITSGHYEKYGEDSFQPIKTPHEGEEFLLKPMNCPHHCEIYKSSPRSYRELPLRLAEFGTVYRYEQHGEVHGLARTRSFTQDDAHIFCTQDQVKEEFKSVIDLVLYVFQKLGFNDYLAQISVRDPKNLNKYIGGESAWNKAEEAIRKAAKEKNLKTIEVEGEAAFYGPKLDFMVKDSLDRKWQLGTVQIDYQLPERFELEYIGEDNRKHRPVIIHRAPFGSLERFIAILLEHTAGNLPLWLAPEQVIILTISSKFNEYAKEVYNTLIEKEVRVSIDERDEKIGKKIRDAENNKVPYMLIIGEKEVQNKTVSIRKHREGDQGSEEIQEFLDIFFN